jgi:hypothetical protein
MSASALLFWVLIAAASVITATIGIRLGWHAAGMYRIRQAGPRRLRDAVHLLWRDPGDARSLDLSHGPGGPDIQPLPPFRFVKEHLSGSQPCVSVLDGRGTRWRVKWGNEVRSENFAVRLVWACGYFAEVTYFVRSGRIEGASGLQRASTCIHADCAFSDARFELDDPAVRKLFEEHSWAWNDNPFVGTRELHGLKILVMLLSDWDTKDRRDVARGSNTAIFEHPASRYRREAQYLITDWGGSMGRWGSNIVTRDRWDPEGFEAQTPGFVTGVRDGFINFGYVGQRTSDVAEGIRTSDARWLHQYLARVSDTQILEALAASGAEENEAQRFSRAIRSRIDQLGRAGESQETVGRRQ